MKHIKFFTFFFLVLTLTIYSCKTQKGLSDSTYILEKIKLDVVTLSADDMEGRETGTPGEKKAANYIAKRMKEIGIKPRGSFDGYFQAFDRKIKSNPHEDKPSPDDKVITGLNVIGEIDNGAMYTAVIGAHYDHLGYGSEGSLYVGEPAIHNGADDNASGIAGMLRIGEALMSDTDKSLNYIFIAFSGEEKGLWGSNYFTKNPTVNINKINYMINMDMIGRLNEDKQLAIYGTGTTPLWEKALTAKKGDRFRKKKEASA